ncbi:unnamed protein product [Effrenium voratum]|nr:unnamed protein product [Effrenium voratum]
MGQLSLAEFLAGGWLEEQPPLRAQLLWYCLTCEAAPALSREEWPAVLLACCAQAPCQEVALRAFKERGSFGSFAADLAREESLPVAFRLRLAVNPPHDLLQQAEQQLLRGETLPPEVLEMLDARSLWPQLLQHDVLSAGALLHAQPSSCPDSPQVTELLKPFLLSKRLAEAKAASNILEQLRGDKCGAQLLRHLILRQPPHLLPQADLPEEWHLVAAQLALRVGNSRLLRALMPRLQCVALLPEVVQAAAGGETWTEAWWSQRAAEELRGAEWLKLEQLLAPKWKCAAQLERIIEAWLDGPGSFVMEDKFYERSAGLLRQLRLVLPHLAARAAQMLPKPEAGWQAVDPVHPAYLVELACCGEDVAMDLSALPRKLVLELASARPDLAAPGLARDASTALWAMDALDASGRAAAAAARGFEVWWRQQRRGPAGPSGRG